MIEVFEITREELHSKWMNIQSLFESGNNDFLVQTVTASIVYEKNNSLKTFNMIEWSEYVNTEGHFFRVKAHTSYYTRQDMEDMELAGQLEYFISNLETA
jgi:hypothetical protein